MDIISELSSRLDPTSIDALVDGSADDRALFLGVPSRYTPAVVGALASALLVRAGYTQLLGAEIARHEALALGDDGLLYVAAHPASSVGVTYDLEVQVIRLPFPDLPADIRSNV